MVDDQITAFSISDVAVFLKMTDWCCFITAYVWYSLGGFVTVGTQAELIIEH